MEYVGLAPVRAIVNDNLYGSIPVNEIEYRIIQTPVFNRLHYIKQLGTAYLVYPGAKHSRFEHSLGVMHLATKILNNLLDSLDATEFHELFTPVAFQKISSVYNSSRDYRNRFSNYIEFLRAFLVQSIRLAGLLHDIGHYPHSHVVEEALGYRGLHEKHSIEIILRWRELEHILRETTIYLDRSSYTGITREHIVAILMNTGQREEFIENNSNYVPMLTLWGYDLLHKIISGVFDADRLDYLRRDALHTGMVYGYIDIDRIIQNMHIVRSDRSCIICYDVKALPALEDMIDARIKMYKLVYFHHKSVILAEIVKRMLTKAIEYEEKGVKILPNESTKSILLDKYVEIVINDPYRVTDEILIHIAKSILDNEFIDYNTKYYAKAFIDRRLLPFTVFKREEELMDFIKKINGGNVSQELSSYRKYMNVIIKKLKELEDKDYDYKGNTLKIMVVPVKYYGVHSPRIFIKTPIGISSIEEVSSFIRWVKKRYEDYSYAYVYAYLVDEKTMINMKYSKSGREELYRVVRGIIGNYIRSFIKNII